MRRVIFHYLTGLSLLLFLAISWLWLRSYSIADQFDRARNGRQTAINSDHGVLSICNYVTVPATDEDFGWRHHRLWNGTYGGGFDAVLGHTGSVFTNTANTLIYHAWWMHHWVLVVITSLLPIAWSIGWSR